MGNNGEPIRVLHVVQRMEAAGLQSFIMNVYRVIDRNKIQFDFLTHYSEKQFYDEEIESLGGRIYRLTVREDKNFIKYLHDLHKFFDEHKEYKIVHGHMDSLGVFYLGAAKRADVETRIAHAHNVIIGEDSKKRVRQLMDKFYKTNATTLFACSEDAGRYMFGDSQFKVVRNPIDVRKFSFNAVMREKVRNSLGLQNKFVIGHVGRFAPQKNHKFVIDVFNEIVKLRPDACLVLVGDGELKEEIKSYCNKLKIDDKIQMLGVRDDVAELYQAFDDFLFPSIYEGLGIVAVEAQASGLPTICSDRVPKLAGATNLFYQLSLDSSPKVWAETCIRASEENKRHDNSEDLMKMGYDVGDVANQLSAFYIRKYYGGGNTSRC